MDHLPSAGEDFGAGNYDEVTLVCHHDTHVRLVYEDWTGVQQERTVGRGTWPIRARKLLGYKTMSNPGDGTTVWGPTINVLNLATDTGIEFTVGESQSKEMPRQLRRAR